MSYSITQNFIAGQPPLLVFTLCLMAFGLTMVVLAYIVGEQEIPNPDVRMDWNKIFSKLSVLHPCVSQHNFQKMNAYGSNPPAGSSSTTTNATSNSSLSHIIDESKSLSAVLSHVVDSGTVNVDDMIIVNVSVKVVFGIRQGLYFLNHFSWFKGNVTAKQLGFGGKYSSQVVPISLNFQEALNLTCHESCYMVQAVCMTLSLPSMLLPDTRSPEKCDVNTEDSVPVHFIETDVEDDKCMTLDYNHDPKLTEMLSIHDRSVVNLHLMHTSYFMFVMVMTLLCYSLIKGRDRHQKNFLSADNKVLLEA